MSNPFDTFGDASVASAVPASAANPFDSFGSSQPQQQPQYQEQQQQQQQFSNAHPQPPQQQSMATQHQQPTIMQPPIQPQYQEQQQQYDAASQFSAQQQQPTQQGASDQQSIAGDSQQQSGHFSVPGQQQQQQSRQQYQGQQQQGYGQQNQFLQQQGYDQQDSYQQQQQQQQSQAPEQQNQFHQQQSQSGSFSIPPQQNGSVANGHAGGGGYDPFGGSANNGGALVISQQQSNPYAMIPQQQQSAYGAQNQQQPQAGYGAQQQWGAQAPASAAGGAGFDPFAAPPAPAPAPPPAPVPLQQQQPYYQQQQQQQLVPAQQPPAPQQQQIVPTYQTQQQQQQPPEPSPAAVSYDSASTRNVTETAIVPAPSSDAYSSYSGAPPPEPQMTPRQMLDEKAYEDRRDNNREITPYDDNSRAIVPVTTPTGKEARNIYSKEISRQAPPDASPLPKAELVRKTGYALSRISFRTIMLKKWKQSFWVQYGSHTMLWFRSQADFDDWLNNPYHTQSQRNFLIKLAVNFVHDLYKPNVRGYQVTQCRSKPYGVKMVRQFKLERWMDYGPTIAAAFGSYDPKEVDELRKAIVECMRNTPLDGNIRATGAVRDRDDGQQVMHPSDRPDYRGRQDSNGYQGGYDDRSQRGGDGSGGGGGVAGPRRVSASSFNGNANSNHVPQSSQSVMSASDLLDDNAAFDDTMSLPGNLGSALVPAQQPLSYHGAPAPPQNIYSLPQQMYGGQQHHQPPQQQQFQQNPYGQQPPQQNYAQQQSYRQQQNYAQQAYGSQTQF